MPTFEVHVFVGPVNPVDTAWTAFEDLVGAYNAAERPRFPMKAYAITSRKTRGDETVLETGMYVVAETIEEAVAAATAQGAFFRARGCAVLREKVEGIVGKMPWAPTTAADAAAHPQRYFEVHVRVSGDGARERARGLGAVSWTNHGEHVLLNLRPRGATLDEARGRMDAARAAARAAGLVVGKTHFEYVLHDTCPEMDDGWFDAE